LAQALSNPIQAVAPPPGKGDDSRFGAILDAAETVFAASGFEGAKMHRIAKAAGVAQGLIHYHFGNKEKLFASIVARRSGHINDKRAALLDGLFRDGAAPTLEDVVNALFRPTIETGVSLASDGGSFSRILVSIANSAADREQGLVEHYYDPIARKFIDAFRTVEPALSKADAVWSYMFAIGVGMTMMAKTGRSLRLSGGQCDDGDVDQILDRIVVYICGGIRALAQEN
jgi:AcrR family transcriptional regulator